VKRTVLCTLLAVVALFVAACGVTTGDEVSSGDDAPVTSAPRGDTGGEGAEDTDTTTGDDTTDTTEGDDPSDTTGSDSSDTTDTTEGDTPDTGGFEMGDEVMRDALIQGFTSAGFTTEQATCLADGYIELGITDEGASPDVMQLMDLFTECGVSLDDLGDIGASLGAGTT
jgi:hypothetical protein